MVSCPKLVMFWCKSHCTTSRKVAHSIPSGITGILYWHNSSGRTVALMSTQPLAEISTRNISWVAGAYADNLTTCMCWLSWNMGPSTSWNLQGLFRPVMGLLYLLAQLEHSYPWIIINMLAVQYLLHSCTGVLEQLWFEMVCCSVFV